MLSCKNCVEINSILVELIILTSELLDVLTWYATVPVVFLIKRINLSTEGRLIGKFALIDHVVWVAKICPDGGKAEFWMKWGDSYPTAKDRHLWWVVKYEAVIPVKHIILTELVCVGVHEIVINLEVSSSSKSCNSDFKRPGNEMVCISITELLILLLLKIIT